MTALETRVIVSKTCLNNVRSGVHGGGSQETQNGQNNTATGGWRRRRDWFRSMANSSPSGDVAGQHCLEHVIDDVTQATQSIAQPRLFRSLAATGTITLELFGERQGSGVVVFDFKLNVRHYFVIHVLDNSSFATSADREEEHAPMWQRAHAVSKDRVMLTRVRLHMMWRVADLVLRIGIQIRHMQPVDEVL